MQQRIENIYDDPFASDYLYALDKQPTLLKKNATTRRVDITLDNQDIREAIFLNRITGDEKTLYVDEAEYLTKDILSILSSKHAETR
ncbi:MAG: hypothetical protein MJZ34_02910 [Paludibacteraceae bacterium]|nr:hypothetical protein [Paludibacteraceae bacterium]